MAHWETAGQSDEWYTPRYVFDALGTAFDTDVAHPGHGDVCCVPARRWITHDSLQKEWDGLVWMNPPFGGRNSLGPWLDKFFAHGNGIALTPDRTSAPWFHDAWEKADAVLFTRKIRFLRPDGSEGVSPSNGTALWAAGPDASEALKRAARRGLGILAAVIAHQSPTTEGQVNMGKAQKRSEFERRHGESTLAHVMRVARVKADRRDRSEPIVPIEAQRHGDYCQDFVTHVETNTKAHSLVNRGGDAVARWKSAQKLTETQCAVIDLMRRLWRLAGIEQRVTATYGERLAPSSGIEVRALNEIEAREDLHRIRGYFPGALASYLDVFENVVRHNIPAGVAGGDANKDASVTRALTVVCFVCDIISTRERI